MIKNLLLLAANGGAIAVLGRLIFKKYNGDYAALGADLGASVAETIVDPFVKRYVELEGLAVKYGLTSTRPSEAVKATLSEARTIGVDQPLIDTPAIEIEEVEEVSTDSNYSSSTNDYTATFEE